MYIVITLRNYYNIILLPPWATPTVSVPPPGTAGNEHSKNDSKDDEKNKQWHKNNKQEYQ
jgi:hypothetical protein